MNSSPGKPACLLCLAAVLALVMSAAFCHAAEPKTLDLKADATLKVAEMNHGDTLRFRLMNGQERTFVLEETRAAIVEKNTGGIVYTFECRLRADGQPVMLRRFVCSQETFYEPWVINGVRIWFSSSASIFKLVPIRYPEKHYKLDAFDAVFALQDATLSICPQPMRPWFPLKEHFIDVGTCYNGDDPWLGPYLGQACHVGLDINMPKGTLLHAPIDFDDHWIFSADHRWRGLRRWPNGEIWALQSHHVDKLLIKEGTPVAAGTVYGEAAGKGVGSHPHSHFELRIGAEATNRGEIGGVELDAWILFWQIFETDKQAKGLIHASIDPLAPAKTGQAVRFSAANSRGGKEAGELRHYWTFGDGGFSQEPSPEHTFARPGVFPVTLVVDDGKARATKTQHITVNGEPLQKPALVLNASDEVTFRPRPEFATDVYNWPVKFVPHTLRFAATPGGEKSAARTVLLANAGAGDLPQAAEATVAYRGEARDWVHFVQRGLGNEQRLEISVNPGKLAAGRYEATVAVACADAINGRQSFRVELNVRPQPTASEVVVDDKDERFYSTPFAWVGHQFLRAKTKGYQERYLTNGGPPAEEAIVRFTPDLAAGRYEVSFHAQTPFVESRFPVRVRHAKGEQVIEVSPMAADKRSLSEFDFAEGTCGFVEVMAKGAQGRIVADAVVFRRVAGSKSAVK